MIKLIRCTSEPEKILQDAYCKCYQKQIKVENMVKVL